MRSQITEHRQQISAMCYVLCAMCLLLATGYWLLSPVSAATIVQKATLAIDTSLIREDINYNVASRILVTPIFLEDVDLQVSDEEIYRGIYYFTIDRLGYADIPYHYIVTENGKIFQGNSGGDERQVAITDLGNDVIVIGYVTGSSATKISSKARQPLVELLADIGSKNAIAPDKIFLDGTSFVRNRTTRSVAMTKKNLFGSWATSIEEIKQSVVPLYNPSNKTYSAEVLQITTPTGEIEPGSEVSLSLRIRNTSNFGFYSTTNSDMIATKVGAGASIFFLNGSWASTTQFPVLGEAQALQPGQEGTFDIKMRAPLYVGQVSEQFELRTVTGDKVTITPFTIALTLKKPSRPIVEVISTETGTLNVRDEPSSVANILTQVSEGQRFFVEEESDTGWVRVNLGDGTTGWLASWYLRTIQ